MTAEIVSPIGISLDSGTMDFGTFISASATGATVVLSADGTTRTFTETAMEMAAYGVFGVPTFAVTKDDDVTYKIGLAVTTPVTGEVTLTDLTSTIGATSNTAAAFSVGGTLNVPTTATAGSYAGEVTVTVTYE
ncbi:DUF4402 domain-containing protein [Gillisia sp. JM1]|uniref:DUF4402 domain-containing protein n=1 Tax=Gillisia sp. JM1 TaxID=1283286 RepID=UPI0018C8FAE1|nr:DUF4402 domain-containing protein [Gillisia sp. JM1]